ncbi:Transcriptional regulator [Caballeronia sordidicola]|uniref:Transcriptional regulator n=1 Tax=Caballeronia sordidicola TaxID=196367 RepID=A0A226WTH4_CABSO|nr:Transcriptional regulator [Caballeronia sordidicola]
MQNLDALLIFARVAEITSFTRAAESLGIQKGRVSTVIRRLELDMGVTLLHRTTRSVKLTEDGRAFYSRARDLLAEVEELQSMFASNGAPLRGRLRVDMPTELAQSVVVPALPQLMAAHPELELELSSTDRRVDLVQEGFDCVIRLGPIVDETLIARPLGKLRMINAASPSYLEQYGTPHTLDDLQSQGHQMVYYTRTLGAKPVGWEYPDSDGYVARAERRGAGQQCADLSCGRTCGHWVDPGGIFCARASSRTWRASGDSARPASRAPRRVARRSPST